jgi:hypothetical protein
MQIKNLEKFKRTILRENINLNKLTEKSNLEKMFDEAKEKAKEKNLRNKKIISENTDMQQKIDHKTLVFNQYKAEIKYMKDKLDEKKGKESTTKKLFNGFKSLFSKK